VLLLQILKVKLKVHKFRGRSYAAAAAVAEPVAGIQLEVAYTA